jgi:hypothetical protein
MTTLLIITVLMTNYESKIINLVIKIIFDLFYIYLFYIIIKILIKLMKEINNDDETVISEVPNIYFIYT